MPHAVCEEQPRTPSAAVAEPVEIGQGEEARTLSPESVAAARGGDPRGLARALRGDLDAIVLKALRKEPELRYASIERFAADLKRHLDGYPVSARRGTLAYRARRYLRRHRVRVAMAAAMAVMTLGFSAALLWGLGRTEAARDRAEIALQRAEREAAAARQVSELLAGIFKDTDPRRAGKGAGALSAREVLERGTERLQGALADQPEVRARLLSAVGEVYVSLGRFREAEPLLREALALREQVFGADSLEVAESLQLLGRLTAFASGPVAELEPLFERALEIRERRLDPGDLKLAESLRSLGVVYVMKHRYEPARDLLERALAIREARLGPEHADVGEVLQRLAQLEATQGRFEAAIPRVERAVAISERHLGPEHPRLVPILGNRARFYLGAGRLEEAEPLVGRVLELAERHLGPDHQYTAESLQTVARVHIARGRFGEARPLLARALEIYRANGGDFRVHVAGLCLQAEVYRELGELGRAEELLDRARAVTRAAGREPPGVSHGLALLRRAQGRHQEAESLLRHALALTEERFAPRHPRVAAVLEDYAPLLRELGREQEAVAVEARARAIRGEAPPG